jgi:phage regulator Rha-like protein
MEGGRMSELVILENNDLTKELYTTTRIIAERGEVDHKSLMRLVQNHEEDLKEFGRVGFEIDTLMTKGGAQQAKVYHLNEQQSTLIITYMKNTKPVREFKKALVREFYRMRAEIDRRKATKPLGIAVRLSLTNAINLLPESPHKAMKYKHYTDLAYQAVFGKATKQLREERGVPPQGELRNRFTADEMEKVLDVENRISVLVGYGMPYASIKELVLRKQGGPT